MKFLSYSRQADHSINQFIKSIQMNKHTPLRHKVEKCGYEIIVITRDGLSDERLELVSNYVKTIQTISKAWQSVFNYADNLNQQQHSWEVISTIGEEPRPRYKQLWRFRGSTSKKHFFLLLSGREKDGLPLHEISFLSNLWQVENGCLPIHSAGIVDKESLYLFGGRSGSGKSTVAKLSQSLGKMVLDDDQVLARPTDTGQYVFDAWGRNIKTSSATLRAIFFLTQANENFLKPISALQASQLLLTRHSEIMTDMLPYNILRQAFRFCSAMARQVPAFELHFRKSPDFWKLIDEQFPD